MVSSVTPDLLKSPINLVFEYPFDGLSIRSASRTETGLLANTVTRFAIKNAIATYSRDLAIRHATIGIHRDLEANYALKTSASRSCWIVIAYPATDMRLGGTGTVVVRQTRLDQQ